MIFITLMGLYASGLVFLKINSDTMHSPIPIQNRNPENWISSIMSPIIVIKMAKIPWKQNIQKSKKTDGRCTCKKTAGPGVSFSRWMNDKSLGMWLYCAAT